MENLKLRRLAVFIENEKREDIVISFAQPCIKVKYIFLKFLIYKNCVQKVLYLVFTGCDKKKITSALDNDNFSDQ